MQTKRSIERLLFSCPEVNCSDYSVYPLVSYEEFMAMEQEFCAETSHVHIYPFVRKREDGKGYIDLYIWDLMLYPESFRRVIICDGYRLSEAEETGFFEYINSDFLFCDKEELKRLNEKIVQQFPSWHYVDYSSYHIREALDHMYFASHCSGAREILYKANLNRIAANLDKIPSYNMVGSNPESIIGYDLPLKLLRILNQPFLISRLYSEKSITQCRAVYKEYSGYIGKRLPSNGQWTYLETLYNNEGMFAGHSFIRALYEKLFFTESDRSLGEYEQFIILRDEIAEIRKIKIPKPEDVGYMVEKLERIRECKSDNTKVDPLFRERKKENIYEYAGEKYVITMPESSMEICKEAIAQGNCVMDYIEKHAFGHTTILFVRRIGSPQKSFVTMEVKDRTIEQVYGRFNTLPKKDVFEFLKEYARTHWLIYDPYELIMRSIVNDEFDCNEELWKYAETFFKNNYIVIEEDDKERSYTQMTLEECFPEVFVQD